MGMQKAEEEFIETIRFYTLNLFPAASLVEKSYQNRMIFHPSGSMMYFEQGCPFSDHLKILEEEEKKNNPNRQEIWFIISKAKDGIRIKCTQENLGSFALKKPLPKKLRGLRDEELQKESGLKDAIFVHTTGFFGVCKSLESSIKLCEMAIAEGSIEQPMK